MREVRKRQGLSQRRLASDAGVSFRCVQQLEEENHNWRISSLRRVARALDLPATGLELFIDRYLTVLPDSVEDISLRMHAEDFDSWKIHLFNFADRFRCERNIALIQNPPIQELDARRRALIASTVEMLCVELGMCSPDWCRGIRGLDTPWFVSGVDSLKAMALVEAPVPFRARNIFVLENFLSRA